MKHLECLVDLPIERLIFSSAFLNKDESLLQQAKALFGQQAIQCLLPLKRSEKGIEIYHPGSNKSLTLSEIDFNLIESLANEIVLVDIEHEGQKDAFNWALLDQLQFRVDKIVVTGGIGKQTVREAADRQIASVLIDNKVLHTEFSVSGYKNAKALR